MSSVGQNTGPTQGSSAGEQTGNPQSIGTPALQPTQRLQGSGTGQGVLGLSDVLKQPSATELKVDTSGASPATSQQTETTPVQQTSFSVPGVILFAGIILLVLAAASFLWSQRNSSRSL